MRGTQRVNGYLMATCIALAIFCFFLLNSRSVYALSAISATASLLVLVRIRRAMGSIAHFCKLTLATACALSLLSAALRFSAHP